MPSDQAGPTSDARRLHPASLVFAVGSAAYRLLIPGLLVLFASRGERADLVLLVMFVPSVLFSLARYLSLRYRFDAGELVIHEGILERRQRHIPYARIQNVDTVQSVLQRLLGVADVVIETAGGVTPEATLKVLSLSAVDEMRARIFAGRVAPSAEDRVQSSEARAQSSDQSSDVREQSSGAGPPLEVARPPAHVVARVTLPQLVLLGIASSERGVAIVAAAFAFASQQGWLSSDWLTRHIGPLESVDVEHMPPRAAAAVLASAALAFAAALFLLSIGWAIVTLFGFTLTRDGDELRTRFGLLTQRSATVPRRRIQLVQLIESPWHRLMKQVSIRVETAGSLLRGETAMGREWLVPLMPRRDLTAILSEIQPEVRLESLSWQSVDPRGRRRFLRKSAIVCLALAIAAVLAAGWWGAAALPVLLALAALHTHRRFKHLAFALDDQLVAVRRGWWKRTCSIVRYGKIQAVFVDETPFDRRWRMATVRIDTAGAAQQTSRATIPYLPAESARALRQRLWSEAARAEFLW